MKRDIGQDTRPPLIISQIGGLHIRIRKECDKIFRQQGFPVEMDQIPVLMILFYQEGLSQQEISTQLLRDKASVNRTVSFLSKRNFTRVIQDSADKRKTRIELTASGKELAILADATLKKIEMILTSALTDKEVQHFSTLINKLIDTCFT